jgi:PIN domain nuclease of toxin-antitoxin system
MKYLLDTHIWLWSLLEPEKLNKAMREVLENPANEFFISPITVWEILILSEKNRLDLKPSAVEWIFKAIEKSQVKEAKLSHAVAIKSRLLDVAHQDPADRFIAATAWEYDFILMTVDEKLKHLEQVIVFA